MNSFQPSDLAMIMGHNDYWDGCIVKIVSPLVRQPGFSVLQGHECEVVAYSPAMMDPSRRPAWQQVGSNVGYWTIDVLEIPKNFSALCTACQGNSFCEVIEITETKTVFKCNAPLSHKYNTPYCSLDHDQRTVEEAKWLTPTSKWAWLSLAPLLTPQNPTQQPTIEYPDSKWGVVAAAEPVCTCDVFNFGCTCPALQHEKNNG